MSTRSARALTGLCQLHMNQKPPVLKSKASFLPRY